MATVFMKWLEQNPELYDRGIRLLTLGRIDRIHKEIVDGHIRDGLRVLELGCGTGELACLMAQAGAQVTAIDVAPAMLAIAQRRIEREKLSSRIKIRRGNATAIDEIERLGKFDLIVASLLLSELSLNEQRVVLHACVQLLEPGGELILIDEVPPASLLGRLVYSFIRFPIALLTFLLTRATTRSLPRAIDLLEQFGFEIQRKSGYLAGSLFVFVSKLRFVPDGGPLDRQVPEIMHKSSLRNFLVDLWALFFRIIPPYPKVHPGFYRFGQPDQNSPVLVTGNFDLTVRKLIGALREHLDAWLLIVDTAGINVWCGAGGGFFTADKVISALKANRVGTYVNHKRLILPQLCANGVDANRIREATGWDVLWGPVEAIEIPEYISKGYQKSDMMRMVRFPLGRRLEMVSGTLGFYGLIFLIPIAIFWRHLFWPALATLTGLSYFYAVALPWLPGRDGLWKSIPMTIISLGGLALFSTVFDPVPTEEFLNRAFGVAALSMFVSAEFQGMSPEMRGEQANWIAEALVGGLMAVIYWLVPLALGWR